MASLRDFEALLNALPEGEKAQLLKWAVAELSGSFPGIESREGVAGGEPCIVRTRIPVWVLEQARRLGATDRLLLNNYPTLRAEDLENAWAYTRAHMSEIETQIQSNESA